MEKYRKLRERVTAAPWFHPSMLRMPEAASLSALELAHDPAYIQRCLQGQLEEREIRKIGFPWSAAMIERSRRSCGATIEACRAALAEGCGVNLAGGTHHAFRDRGEGYCVFNDSAVAARLMQVEGRVKRLVIVDCDVHQGNGTASILRGDDSIFTFSIHGAKNFPFRKEKSDLDIELADQTQDGEYLEKLQGGLTEAFQRSRPELALYLAGADPFVGDRLGRLGLSKEGLAHRDRLVFSACLAAGVPIAVAMAGGYAPLVEDIVDIHFQTVELAVRTFAS